MYSNFLHPCIPEPTRLIKKQKPSLIDNTIVDVFNKKIISDNLFDKISDHLSNFVVIKNINNKQLINIREGNANVMFINIYQDKLINILDKHAPYRTLSRKQQKSRLKPCILNSARKKNELYRKYKKTQNKFWYCRYEYYRDTINTLISKNKRNLVRNFSQQNCTNSKESVAENI